MELERFVCDRTTPPTIKKLRSKSIAVYAYTARIPEVHYMNLCGAVPIERKDRVRIEFRSQQRELLLQCLKG